MEKSVCLAVLSYMPRHVCVAHLDIRVRATLKPKVARSAAKACPAEHRGRDLVQVEGGELPDVREELLDVATGRGRGCVRAPTHTHTSTPLRASTPMRRTIWTVCIPAHSYCKSPHVPCSGPQKMLPKHSLQIRFAGCLSQHKRSSVPTVAWLTRRPMTSASWAKQCKQEGRARRTC